MKTLILFAAASTAIITSSTIIEEIKHVEAMQTQKESQKSLRVYEDRRLTSMCLVGAMAGAFMAIAIWPSSTSLVEGTTPEERAASRVANEKVAMRMLSLKFGVSLFSGCTLTPMLIAWRGWEINTDIVLGTSTIIATSFVYITHKALPIIEKLLEAGRATDFLVKIIGNRVK